MRTLPGERSSRLDPTTGTEPGGSAHSKQSGSSVEIRALLVSASKTAGVTPPRPARASRQVCKLTTSKLRNSAQSPECTSKFRRCSTAISARTDWPAIHSAKPIAFITLTAANSKGGQRIRGDGQRARPLHRETGTPKRSATGFNRQSAVAANLPAAFGRQAPIAQDQSTKLHQVRSIGAA